MASDWIKMRCNLWTHPKVALMAARLTTKKATVIGALHGVWTLADQHADEGFVTGLTAEMVDASAELPGFAEAMKAAGWIAFDAAGAHFPAYEEHNGSTAKKRSAEARRMSRKRVASHATSVVAPDATRREENRGDKSNTPPAAQVDDKPGFLQFWAAWPPGARKQGKPNARKLWQSKQLEAITPQVIAALEVAKRSHDWTKNNGEFIPMPTTWLNRAPWESDPADLSPRPSPQTTQHIPSGVPDNIRQIRADIERHRREKAKA